MLTAEVDGLPRPLRRLHDLFQRPNTIRILNRMKKKPSSRPRWFSFEKLDVYHKAVAFRVIAKRIIARYGARAEEDCKQLDRASKSIVRNICEGAGELRRGEKNRFYRMSQRSADECGGIIKMMVSDFGADDDFDAGEDLLLEIIPMLIALCKSK
jgi:four helix bundle protein